MIVKARTCTHRVLHLFNQLCEIEAEFPSNFAGHRDMNETAKTKRTNKKNWAAHPRHHRRHTEKATTQHNSKTNYNKNTQKKDEDTDNFGSRAV